MKLRVIIKLVLIFIFTLNCKNALALQIKNLTVLAEPNMVSSLTKLSRIYSQKNRVTISVNFSSSTDLISEIESGEPADVFISAHKFWIENLKQKGLVDIYNISHIADDSLVLVTSDRNSKIPYEFLNQSPDLVSALSILDSYGSEIVIDHDGTSLGQYSQQLVTDLNLKQIKIFNRLQEDKNSVLNIINTNPQSYTILLSSEVKDKKNIKILSSFKNSQIFYQALVIAGDNMENAREFVKFLKTKEAISVFYNSGFIIEQ